MSLRDNRFSDVRVPVAWVAALALIVAGGVAVALMVTDRRETLEAQAYGTVKSTIDMVQAPISGALAAPVRWTEGGVTGIRGYFFAVSQNRKLRKENAELRRWRDAAIALQDTNDRFRALLGMKTDPPIPTVTGRSVTDLRGPFANSRLINVGREAGVVVGYPVMSENGLVGRIVGVTAGGSRALLVTDAASRTPVMIDRTNARAILTGDGGPNPKLMYLRGRDPVKSGDRILTSGDGGVLPRGLPVGVAVKGLDDTWRVQLFSDYSPIDFVRILKFDDFSQLLNERELSTVTAPLPTPGMPPLVRPQTAAPPKAAAPASKAATQPTGPSIPAAKLAPLRAPPPQVAPQRPASPTPAPKGAAPARAVEPPPPPPEPKVQPPPINQVPF